MQRLRIILQSKLFVGISILFLISYVFIFTKIVQYKSNYTDNTNEFVGIILDYDIDGDKLGLTLKAKEKIKVTYYFKTLEEKELYQKELKLGQRIKVLGVLNSPGNNTIPNTFNYKDYLYNKKIYWLLSAQKIEFLNNNISIFYKIKNAFITKVNNYKNTSSYMHAFILGDNGYIDSDVYANFRNNGVTHLFAVSGMHIGFFVMAIAGLLKKIKVKENMVQVITILFLIFYMFLVGFSASVVRASLFYILLLINKKLNINFKSIFLLYYLLLILLIINPFYIYDIGFVYSFLTSFGLILFSKKITGNYITKLFKTSFIAFMFSLPVTLYNFYEFNLMTVLNNLIIVPFVSIILFPLTLITFIFPFLEFILNFGFNILEIINNCLNSLSISIVVAKISFIFIFLYYLIIYLSHRFKMRYISLIVVLLLVNKGLNFIDSNSYIYYLDVGQGDSSLIITEHKQDVILIDSGGKIDYEKEKWQKRNSNFSLADNISQFLKSLGISKVDLFVGTHGDADHIGYAKEILKKIKVKKIMFNHNDYNYAEKDLLKLASNFKSDYYKGKNILLQNLNSYVGKDENDSSLVIYTKLKNKQFLFMGDAPKKIELDIIKKYNLTNIDFLKVGHHGSDTSSDKDFINSINPKYSLISAGKNNRYGHPKESVLETLSNTRIYRTDINGTIKVKLNKNKYQIETYSP